MSNIVLVGFMCTGKSLVGKRLAATLGLKFIDSDQVIEARAGKTVEQIFADDGEAKFRQLERTVIAHLASKSGQVIATGGGALGDRRNLVELRRSGTLVCLTASPQAILERSRRGPARPLLKVPKPRARIEELLAARACQYAQADYHLDTTELSPEQAAARIAHWLSVVPVNLGERSYEIVIGRDLLFHAEEHLRPISRGRRPIVISEERVWEYHGLALCAGLPKHQRILLPALDDQEKIKSLRYAEQLYSELLSLGARRDSLLIAFGGGTVGDLVGFVAATYMRGLEFVQIPTTLLAQVDSSVGGKVAVNHPRAKNLIGAFWQPQLVLADLHCLDTLPRRQFRNGLGEVIKHALLADPRLFAYLESHVEEVMRLSVPAMRHLLRRNCEIKADIVSRDEREAGPREALNLGHTFAHALETVADYQGLSHGEAVSIGLAAAGRLAARLGLFSDRNLQRLLALLQAYHLPVAAPQLPVVAVLSAMQSDKKARQGGVRFVLPVRLGRVRVVAEVPRAEVRAALTGRPKAKA